MSSSCCAPRSWRAAGGFSAAACYMSLRRPLNGCGIPRGAMCASILATETGSANIHVATVTLPVFSLSPMKGTSHEAWELFEYQCRVGCRCDPAWRERAGRARAAGLGSGDCARVRQHSAGGRVAERSRPSQADAGALAPPSLAPPSLASPLASSPLAPSPLASSPLAASPSLVRPRSMRAYGRRCFRNW